MSSTDDQIVQVIVCLMIVLVTSAGFSIRRARRRKSISLYKVERNNFVESILGWSTVLLGLFVLLLISTKRLDATLCLLVPFALAFALRVAIDFWALNKAKVDEQETMPKHSG